MDLHRMIKQAQAREIARELERIQEREREGRERLERERQEQKEREAAKKIAKIWLSLCKKNSDEVLINLSE